MNPDNYIDKYFPVLDHGAVALVDYLGSDGSIEQAARVSYGAGTRTKRKTRGLIRYLMRHRHDTPSEMVTLKFHISMPLFVARQHVRHRASSMNEYSGRYSVLPKVTYTPAESRFGAQDKNNRQGTSDEEAPDIDYSDFKGALEYETGRDFKLYDHFLDANVARELARIGLPLNAYTEFYWQTNLRMLFHFLGLRMDPHAQWEIRQYANIMAGLAYAVAPLATEAFFDYHLNSYSLSNAETEALRDICAGGRVNEEELSEDMSNREIQEFKSVMFDEREPFQLEDFVLDLDEALTPEQARIRLHGEEDLDE